MKIEGVRKLWDRYKFAALVLLIGAGMLLWPGGSGAGDRTGSGTAASPVFGDTADLQRDMEEILSQIQGVGIVRVLLTLDTDGERQLAQNAELRYSGSTASPEDYARTSEPVLVDGGDREEAIVTQRSYPTYRGALVVCQGGDRAEVRLAVTEAVSALTGLPSDRVTVAKCQ